MPACAWLGPFVSLMGIIGSAVKCAQLQCVSSVCSTVMCDASVMFVMRLLCVSLQDALKGLHWLPTLDCLALSPDPAIKARAAAALAALATAGQLDSQEAQIRWRDMLLGWLGSSTANLLLANSSSGSGSSAEGSSGEGGRTAAWLWRWFSEDAEAGGAAAGKGGRCQATAADEALARSCVAALRGRRGHWGLLDAAGWCVCWAVQCCEHLP